MYLHAVLHVGLPPLPVTVKEQLAKTPQRSEGG